MVGVPAVNGSSDFEAVFRRAMISEGDAYLMAESELRDSPESAPVLRAHLSDPDPIGRLAAGVMLEWSESSGDDFGQVTEYLDDLQRTFAPTVAGAPRVTGVIEDLTRRFGGRLAEFLALRLVQQPQPSWRVLTTLGYLDRHKNPATTEALIRFAAQTREPRLQQLAAQVVANLGDPALAQKLQAERDRLVAQGGALPPALASITASPGATA
ncbi:MAG: hypothetical protein ACJ768_10280 [Gaiellaceae bacterium]